MTYEELKKHLTQEALKVKFRNDTNDGKRLRNYFKNMVEELTKPLVEIDTNFYEYGEVRSHADNYAIFGEWKIIVSERDDLVYFKKSDTQSENYLLVVSFLDGRAIVNDRELQESDLEQFLIDAILN